MVPLAGRAGQQTACIKVMSVRISVCIVVAYEKLKKIEFKCKKFTRNPKERLREAKIGADML